MWYYLCIGIGVYLTSSAMQWHTFIGASYMGMLRGLMGILVWPLILYILYKSTRMPKVVDIQPIYSDETDGTLDLVTDVHTPGEEENYGFPRKK